ncbi:NAD(P)-binding protein [Tothia fuscella]|uniref:3-dehydrosphinganine reductase n=1 Tax=Tothia fuscella TaxID=1048955 RepID=A0A9P4NTS6_9PEZI|nr:NAD(P)-binding protein [Tothia fuscella]
MESLRPYLLSLVLLIATAVLLMGFFSKNKFVVEGRTVLLTGGSQGMGRGLAKLFAQKGANVVIVARDVKKLEAAVEYIQSSAKSPQTQRFHFISADLTSSSENERIVKEVTEWNNGNPPDIVWANAGYSKPQLFLDASIESMRNQMETNFWAATYLAHTTLRTWLTPSASSPKDGSAVPTKEPLPRHFIMTSSVAALCGIAGYAPYSPGKAALRSLADTLRSEVQLYNGSRHYLSSSSVSPPPVKIHIVLPGTITSPGYVEENKTKHPVTHVLEEGDLVQTEDEVAAAAFKGLEAGNYMITTQFLGHAMRVGMLGGSPRGGVFGIRDLLFGWVIGVAWLFISPDMERKVWRWGRKNGVQSGAVKTYSK